MRRTMVLLALALAVGGIGQGETVAGYISDEGCALETPRNPECTKACISNGAVAVLVTDDGEIYRIADQEKIKPFAGERVAVTGAIEGNQIKTVEQTVHCSKSAHCEG